LNRAILARRIHRLKYQQQGPTVLRVQHVLLLSEPLRAASEQLGRLALAQLQAASVCGIDAVQAKGLALGNAEWVDVFLDAVEDFSSWHGAAPCPDLTLVGCQRREMIAVFRKASQGSDSPLAVPAGKAHCVEAFTVAPPGSGPVVI